MNDLNKIRSTLHPFAGLVGIGFAAAALLKFAGVLRIGSTVADLALIAVAMLIL